jgi:hypothetical protein
MKRHKFTASFAIAVTVLCGLARFAAAAELVPFRGDLEGMRVSSTPLEAPYVLNTSIVTGNATHLGSYQLTITLVVNTANLTSMGTYEFVASNGDTLTADVAGTAEMTSTPGVTSIVEISTVTGGTGRFEGATGDIVCTRLGNRFTGITVGTFDGTISTPGSN